jgi:hypothetical protein
MAAFSSDFELAANLPTRLRWTLICRARLPACLTNTTSPSLRPTKRRHPGSARCTAASRAHARGSSPARQDASRTKPPLAAQRGFSHALSLAPGSKFWTHVLHLSFASKFCRAPGHRLAIARLRPALGLPQKGGCLLVSGSGSSVTARQLMAAPAVARSAV